MAILPVLAGTVLLFKGFDRVNSPDSKNDNLSICRKIGKTQKIGSNIVLLVMPHCGNSNCTCCLLEPDGDKRYLLSMKIWGNGPICFYTRQRFG